MVAFADAEFDTPVKESGSFARVRTFAFAGIEAVPVEVQVQISSGQMCLIVVGLPDKAVGVPVNERTAMGDTVAQRAYSYLRFSTPEQIRGDSFRRQSALAAEYARQHGLTLDSELTFDDLGVSAFRGRNAETGRLGDFLAAVEDGLVPPGSFLLVESLDRISRQTARRALRVLEDIVDRGVTVVTLNDGRAYTRDGLNDDPMSLLLALLTFIRANEESATKSRRLVAAWSAKRAKASSKPLTSVCPAWLRLDPALGRFEPLEDRAKVVQRIYAEAVAGKGQHTIAQGLNRDGVPVFGHRGRVGRHWHSSYVLKLLTSRPSLAR